MILNQWFEADIKDCARCGEDHADLRFEVVKYHGGPTNDFFALCPVISQPLTITIDDGDMSEGYIGLTKVPTRPDVDDL